MHAPWSFVPLKDDEVSCTPREDKFGAMVEEVDYVDTWAQMEKCVELGLCRNLAVSNFSSKQIERLLEKCKIKPVINQVECHAYFNNQASFSSHFCSRNTVWICLETAHRNWMNTVRQKVSRWWPSIRLAKLESKMKTLHFEMTQSWLKLQNAVAKLLFRKVDWNTKASLINEARTPNWQSITGVTQICNWTGHCPNSKVISSWATKRKLQRLRLRAFWRI